jgi:monovalent cation:H+ antiporter-2, CPA2 family
LIWLADRLRPQLEARAAAVPEAMIDGRVEPVVGDGTVSAPPPEEEELVHPTALTAHTILVGYGRVGTVVAEGLKAAGRPFLLIEDADNRITAAHKAGIEVVVGNAAATKPLRLANVEGAATIIVAIPNAFEAGQAVEQARRANPKAQIVARAHSDEERNYLLDLGADTAILGEREIGMAMLDLVSPSTIARTAGTAALEAALAPAAVAAMATAPAPTAPNKTTIDEEALARAIGAPIPPLLPPEFLPPEPPKAADPPPPPAPRRPSTTPGAAFSGRPPSRPPSGTKTPEKQS